MRSVDPHSAIAAGIDPARIIGCVVYPACEIEALLGAVIELAQLGIAAAA